LNGVCRQQPEYRIEIGSGPGGRVSYNSEANYKVIPESAGDQCIGTVMPAVKTQ